MSEIWARVVGSKLEKEHDKGGFKSEAEYKAAYEQAEREIKDKYGQEVAYREVVAEMIRDKKIEHQALVARIQGITAAEADADAERIRREEAENATEEAEARAKEALKEAERQKKEHDANTERLKKEHHDDIAKLEVTLKDHKEKLKKEKKKREADWQAMEAKREEERKENQTRMDNLNQQIVALANRPMPSGGCFAANCTVTLADGRVVRMGDVKFGDRIQTGTASASAVYWVEPHVGPFELWTITSESGRTVTLTGDHLLWAADAWTMACNVCVGDALSDSSHVARVERRQGDESTEVVACLTLSDCLLVGGLLCSAHTNLHYWNAVECLDMKLMYYVWPSALESRSYAAVTRLWDAVFDPVQEWIARTWNARAQLK